VDGIDENLCATLFKKMAKLVAVCRDEMDFAFERRQIPLVIEETLTVILHI
jgi:hypothetical protein